jgi:hypothetical protein
VRIRIERKEDELLLTFNADTEDEQKDLKAILLESFKGGFSFDALIDGLEKRGYGDVTAWRKQQREL